MNTDILGLIIATFLISLILLFVMLLKKKTNLSDEILRKIVHITVSNWWIFNLFFIKDPQIALIAPIIFICVNSIFVFKPESGVKFGFSSNTRNIGLVYYPISFLILIYFCYNNKLAYAAGTIGAMSMGYGDGFAALIGLKWGKRKVSKYTGNKTYLGTFFMAVICNFVSLITLTLMSDLSISSIVYFSIIIGLSGALIELVTPKNLDNLSVPLGLALITGMLL